MSFPSCSADRRAGRALWIAASLLAAACAGEAPPKPAEGTTGDEELERLRSLPYAGGSARGGVDGDGVLIADPARMAPGDTWITLQALNRAERIAADGSVRGSWSAPVTSPPSWVWERSRPAPDGDVWVIGCDDHRPPGVPFLLPDDARYLMRLAPDGSPRWKRALTAHHDVIPLDDGSWVALTFERRQIPELSAEVDTRDDTLSWIDPADGRVTRTASLLDAIRASPEVFELRRAGVNQLAGRPWLDILHANAVQRVEAFPLESGPTPGWLVTFRHQNRVALFDDDVTRVLWAWGDRMLGGPHDGQLLPGGTVLIFDNGLGRGWSRVLEVDPGSGDIVWEYRGDPPRSFYTLSKGSAQRLPNGNTLIAQSDAGRVIEVTTEGEIVWEYRIPHDSADGERAALVRARRLAD